MAKPGYRSTVIREEVYTKVANLVKSPKNITSVSDFIEVAVLEKLARDEISGKTQCNAAPPAAEEKEVQKT
ncbi:MAG: hypothetical protein JRN19_01700 [Nitrososphaerota archaeon]|nr:hypothetical protein [Nitrososphaerota archaeon]MDG7048655.1 hypothetical protein [Nitrososphaerota archaeon]MDG7051154.1 hypothetical protein [Nitrososphaerota archaeon]